MSENSTPTFILKEMKTFPLKVELAIPPERPVMKGYVMVDALVKTKDEIKALGDEQLEDAEYFDKLVVGVRGMANDAGTALSAEEGVNEVKNGRFNMYLLPAIVGAYFDQYGEARRKNSMRSSRR